MDRFLIRKKRVREEEVPVNQPIGDSDGVSKAQQPKVPAMRAYTNNLKYPVLGLNMTQVIKVCYVLFVRNMVKYRTSQRCLGY